MHAHGGGILKVKDTFYWFGESYKRPLLNDYLSEGVNLYSSTDMATWHYNGLVFNGTEQMKDLPAAMGQAPFRIERPKVPCRSLHNQTPLHTASSRLALTTLLSYHLCTNSPLRRPQFIQAHTKVCHDVACMHTVQLKRVGVGWQILFNERYNEYVLLFHADTVSFAYPSVGVAVAKEITGPYTWVRIFQPDGQSSYDMGVFQEDDGTAFLVRSVKNEFVGISQLSPDYTDTLGISSTAPRVRPWQWISITATALPSNTATCPEFLLFSCFLLYSDC